VRRGVTIRILMESELTDAMPVKYASRYRYERLLQRGVALYEYLPTMMHTKTLVVDGIWNIFGSANFDNRSLELNDEMNLGVNSRSLAQRFVADFEQDIKVSRKIDLDSWRRRPRLDKMRERFWVVFGEVF
jgi:cardiolipin synthase A/B